YFYDLVIETLNDDNLIIGKDGIVMEIDESKFCKGKDTDEIWVWLIEGMQRRLEILCQNTLNQANGRLDLVAFAQVQVTLWRYGMAEPAISIKYYYVIVKKVTNLKKLAGVTLC
ncbi:5376_t:CDS:2, partial [Acaulospora morrowiae]